MNIRSIKVKLFLTLLVLLYNSNLIAQEAVSQESILACMSEILKTAPENVTTGQMRKACKSKIKDSIDERFIFAKQAANNPFALLPHKPNYILPFTYSEPKHGPYGSLSQEEQFDHAEIKFQFSIKFLAAEDVLYDDVNLYTAFTTNSWWQAYNSQLSAPFRETNYEPEIIFDFTRPWKLLGFRVVQSSISLNHQSNGQSAKLSRSWNRIIASTVMNSGDLVWNGRLWWRYPEKDKTLITDIDGDDNPDIEKYLGYGDLSFLWKLSNHNNIDLMLRNNFRSKNRGAIQLGWSFPLFKHLRGYVEYFGGYGESLIYYDENTQRIGLGFKLTDWL